MPDRSSNSSNEIVERAGRAAGGIFDCSADEFSQWLPTARDEHAQVVRRRLDSASSVPAPRMLRRGSRSPAMVAAPLEVVPKPRTAPGSSEMDGSAARSSSQISSANRSECDFVVSDIEWANHIKAQRLTRLLAMEQQCYDARLAAERTAEQWLQLYEYQQDQWHNQTPLAPRTPMP